MLLKRFALLLLFAITCVIPSRVMAGLSGTYLVGSGGHFATLNQALASLAAEGMDSDVIIKVVSAVQVGPFVVGTIPGQSAHHLTVGPSGIATITLLTADTTRPVLTFSNAEKVHFNGFSITSPALSQPAVRITEGSHNVTLSGATLKGRGAGRIVEIIGSGCNDNLLQDCALRRGGEAVYLAGSSESASGNTLLRCVIDSVAHGIVLTRQSHFTIERCTISPNAGAVGTSTAISIGAQAPEDSVFVEGNTISEVTAGSGYAVAIRHNPLNSFSFLAASNNFIYDFRNTGSSQIRAVYLSGGENRVVNNSILVNDVAATGAAYALYNGLLAPDAKLSIENNILVNLEATRPAYNLFNLTAASGLSSNHNLFYGTGAAYQLGWLIQPYHSLTAWRTGTGLDAASKVGDPQFTSPTDLHLTDSSALAHQNGTVALDVPRDHDGQLRFQPPDIGADEYEFAAPDHDAAILSVIGLPQSFPEHSLLALQVHVQNRGSSPLFNLPLRLSYDDSARAEVIAQLDPSESDTFLLVWSTGAIHLNAQLSVEAVLGTDAFPTDNARNFELAVTGQPLSGVYRVGGFNADFQTLSAAASALTLRGVADDVTLNLAAGIYDETLLFESIAGLGPTAALVIRPAPDAEGIVLLAPTEAQQILTLRDVSYVTAFGLVVQGTENSQSVISLEENSHHITLRDCRITGGSLVQSASSAVSVSHGCFGNRFERLEISTAYNGIHLEGSGAISDADNVIRECAIQDVRTGIHAVWQNGLRIESCRISSGYVDAPSPCYGIRIGNLHSGDTVRVFDNQITRCLSAGNLYGLACESGSGAIVVVNNRIGQFDSRTSGIVNAVSIQSGQVEIFHNSINIGDLASPQVTGVNISGNQTVVAMLNNIISVEEPQATARFIEWTGGEITSNNNLYDAPGANTQFRFARSSLDGDFASLMSWTEITGQDSLSLAAAAGFVSSDDLHIRPDASGPSNHGAYIPEFTVDIDGEPRDSLPDVGADEYEFSGAITDIAVTSIELPVTPLQAATEYVLVSSIRNIGANPVSAAMIRLSYNLVPVDSQIVSLGTGELHDVVWNWTSPQVNFAYGSLRAEIVATGDVVPDNNFIDHSIVVAGAPLSGTLSVAPEGGDFSSLTSLSEHLKWRGIDAPTTVLLAQGVYAGPLTLSEIPGADSLRQLVIMPETGASVSITAADADAVITLMNSDHVQLRELTIVCGANTPVGLSLDAFSCGNLVSDCDIAGPGASSIGSVGIMIGGAECNGNRIEDSRVTGCYTGIQLTGDPVNLSRDNVVKANDVADVYYGIWVDHQRNAQVTRNDIRPGTVNGPAGACYGIYVVQLGTNGNVLVEGNWIHDFIDTPGPRTNRAAGVYSAPGISSSVEIVNNFIYGFSELVSLRTRAIYLSSGSHLVANNSIRLDDAPADNETAGIFVSTGTQHELFNNCVMGYENDVVSYALDVEAGADVVSDYNCFWGNSSNFRFAAFGAQDYEDLPSWRATGQDEQSLEAHAQYESSTDLHVRVTDSTMFARGISLAQVSSDIDGEIRPDPPCIGADEYVYLATLQAPQGLTILISETLTAQLVWQPVFAATTYRIFGAESIEALQNSPLELGVTTETSWSWDVSAAPENLRFFLVRAE